MDLFEKYLGEASEHQRKGQRYFVQIPDNRDTDTFMKFLRSIGLNIGDDWDWITSTTLSIGKSVWNKKIENKAKQMKLSFNFGK